MRVWVCAPLFPLLPVCAHRSHCASVCFCAFVFCDLRIYFLGLFFLVFVPTNKFVCGQPWNGLWPACHRFYKQHNFFFCPPPFSFFWKWTEKGGLVRWAQIQHHTVLPQGFLAVTQSHPQDHYSPSYPRPEFFIWSHCLLLNSHLWGD